MRNGRLDGGQDVEWESEVILGAMRVIYWNWKFHFGRFRAIWLEYAVAWGRQLFLQFHIGSYKRNGRLDGGQDVEWESEVILGAMRVIYWNWKFDFGRFRAIWLELALAWGSQLFLQFQICIFMRNGVLGGAHDV